MSEEIQETEESQAAEKLQETVELQETEESQAAEKLQRTGVLQETEESYMAEESQETGVLQETGESQVAEELQETEESQAAEKSQWIRDNLQEQASDAVVSVTVTMKVKYMYSFLFQHLHRSVRGIFGVVLSLAALVMFFLSLGTGADSTRLIILLIIGLLFTVVNPIMLFFKAQQQVLLSPVFKKPLTYIFSEEGITVVQEEQSQFIEWKQVIAVRKTASVLIIYTSRNSGSILAFKELKEKRKAVEALIACGCKSAGIKQLPGYMKKL